MNIPGRPAYAQVDLAATFANTQLIKKRIAPAKLMAVVKANAYGHGAPQIAKTVLAAGADYLAVATVEEAAILRNSQINCPILILGWVAPDQLKQALLLNVALTVFDLANAIQISKMAQNLGIDVAIHLKLDTGMSRLGFSPKPGTLLDIEQIFGLPGLKIEGLFSHFAMADADNQPFTIKQFEQFCDFKEAAQKRGLDFPICHIANSPAVLNYPQAYLDMVRPGLLLHGYTPAGSAIEDWPLKPALTIKAQISQIHEVGCGDTVGYGRTWQAGRASKIATLPLGYADGLPRLLSNNGYVLIHGEKMPIIGKVCMDHIMVDISDLDEVECGEEAIILGGQGAARIDIEQMAQAAQTISYELLTRFGQRLPHYYING